MLNRYVLSLVHLLRTSLLDSPKVMKSSVAGRQPTYVAVQTICPTPLLVVRFVRSFLLLSPHKSLQETGSPWISHLQVFRGDSGHRRLTKCNSSPDPFDQFSSELALEIFNPGQCGPLYVVVGIPSFPHPLHTPSFSLLLRR